MRARFALGLMNVINSFFKLWITAEKQNKKTATFFWPGSDVNISGIKHKMP